MDIAIVTGASSSLGLAISRRLIQLGFRVYGLGGDYKDCPLQNVNFRPTRCDLSSPESVESACQQILEKEKGVYVVINNAKYYPRKPFLDMDAGEIEKVIRINLLCPLIIARCVAGSVRELQGYFIQLGSPHAESSNGGAVGAASAGGLKWMGEQLFSELRDAGVKVCHLCPEPNRERDTRKQVRKGALRAASIDPEAVAQAVEQMLQSPFGNVVTEMVLRPLRIDEPEMDPVVKLPYPEPQPIPYTVPREMIEAEEQLEEEEWKKKQEKRKRKRQAARKSVSEETESSGKESKAPDDQKITQKPVAEEDSSTSAEPEADSRQRRRRRRKPRPQKVEVGFLDNKEKTQKPEESTEQNPPVKKESGSEGEKIVAKKAPRKTASKKTAVKKTPARKTAAKKSSRKRVARKATGEKNPPREAKKSPEKTDKGKNPA